MPINVYTGLMRSGKSYEVVSEVILSAIAAGRRVVTNVDGISNDLVRAYVAKKEKLSLDVLGHVVHVTNQDVFKPDFFPYYDDAKGAHTETLVQPGDLVCIDEAWRFWPATGANIHQNHKSFFLEHGHFTDEKTGVACDLVLMIQDMGTLNRFIKNVVAFNFRTHKKVSLGLGSVYSVVMFEGAKQSKATQIGSWVRKYKKEIFPLYSSFKGGADGKTVNVDKRQNIFTGKKLWLSVFGVIMLWGFGGYYAWRFFHPTPKSVVATSGAVVKPSKTSPGTAVPMVSNDPESRLAGAVTIDGLRYVLVVTGSRYSFFSPSQLEGVFPAQFIMVDGQRVSR
ncbi:MAG: zonula occludens toxin [Deltaproteobacteria bacterium RIFCSPLOWO2_02_FULL_53_8]|nr:MAG: zonula occludens toxin [Deltaproteobacteria bacterium RIFCSPLOWO2_02_FULL_53_8]